MKIGILYPRSKAHPAIGLDFMDGLRAFLKRNNLENDLSLAFESIGFGGDEKEVYEKAEKLLLMEQADALVAFVDLRVKPILDPLLYATGKLALIVNPGANYPQNWVPQPNVACLSLQHAFLCWLTGGLATEGAAGLTATSFYDCGYLHIAAMVKGLEKKQGSLTFNYINKQPYNEPFEIGELTGFLAAHENVHQLLCLFDTLPASLFYQRLNEYPGAERLRLLVSPMMLEPAATGNPSSPFRFSIEGHVPWQPSLPGQPNQEFLQYYQQHTQRPASLFSLLGWETGMILQELYTKKDSTDGAALVRLLAQSRLESPRGALLLDAATNYFVAPAYRVSLPSNGEQAPTCTLVPVHEPWQAFTEERTEGTTSGWMNTYLCY